MQTPPPLHCPRPRGPVLMKTPEPATVAADEEAWTTPPTRPPRLRLKRRAVSHLTAPTQQFLASVAAADVPLPSIETAAAGAHDDMLDVDDQRGRPLESPRTPPSRTVPSLSPKRFPDWTIDTSLSSLESSPDFESSRPSTARSTQTSASLFSRFSDHHSQCASPEENHVDRFGPLASAHDADKTIKAFARPATLRKAPWTRTMSKHLWSTYMMYLQDPKVTPFRIGRSGIPPSGVCLRVAREAKRSWKGSRSSFAANSGSTTPRAEPPAPYVLWPHTCAATRAHLRELCKINNATTSRGGAAQYMAHSPTLYGKTATRFWNRRSAPPHSPPNVFSGSDMAKSLVVCTAESMQLQGPLARLAMQPEETECPEVGGGANNNNRLGSPFVAAKSYGPSSSGTLADCLGVTTKEPQRQSQTVGSGGGRSSLGSPVRLKYNNRSSTQKRRSRQPTAEPRKSKRPILGSDFWTDPSSAEEEKSSTAAVPFAEFCSTSSNVRDKLFVPRTNVQELFEASCASSSSSSLPEAMEPSSSSGRVDHQPPPPPPPRLGSPFQTKSTSFSFPSRRASAASVMGFAAARRPFATVHQSSEGGAVVAAADSVRASLASRLAYIDGRLQDLRREETPSRRSHSPF
ncbi:hypothetical protein L249_3506 [Ophiocordyceps polyrhachis-furcata BCC 54312]|uniref:Uncharacterized protein n=1 Tax=Ophiocordyceps polyrhachis-furcata BCC 54312 TaxID=1330021 RepID=A0A367LMK2_9HYPO|nr:hypothetical protein L249_3506 [Ophiocordyceps polyrhachis-furcata BCC 54312]